jgi:hypothetical protein
VEAVTGATTVILRAGALAISNLEGVTVNIDTPGLASTVAGPDAAPTPPAPHILEAFLTFEEAFTPGLEFGLGTAGDWPRVGGFWDLFDPEPEAVPRIESETKGNGGSG